MIQTFWEKMKIKVLCLNWQFLHISIFKIISRKTLDFCFLVDLQQNPSHLSIVPILWCFLGVFFSPVSYYSRSVPRKALHIKLENQILFVNRASEFWFINYWLPPLQTKARFYIYEKQDWWTIQSDSCCNFFK